MGTCARHCSVALDSRRTVRGSELLQALGNPHKRDPHSVGLRMLAPRLHGIHMGHEFLGSRTEGLVLESFLHEYGEPTRVLVLASKEFLAHCLTS